MAKIDELLANLDIEKFTKDWDSGKTLVELSKIHGFGWPGYAKQIAQSLNLNIRKDRYLHAGLDVAGFTKDWNSGMSLIDLEKKYNLSYSEKAKKIAKRLGLDERYRIGRFDDIDISEFQKMYLNNKITIKEIQKKFNFADAGYVSKLANQLNLPIRFGGGSTKFDEKKDQFVELWNMGKTLREISEELGINIMTIKNWRQKLNISPRFVGWQYHEKIKNLLSRLNNLLQENNGAIFEDEIINQLNLSEQQLQTILKSDDFDSITLSLGGSVSPRWSNKLFFGFNTNQTIIFFNNCESCILLKLAEILNHNDEINGRFYTKDANFYLTKLLFNKKPNLKKHQDLLYDLVKKPHLWIKLKKEISAEIFNTKITSIRNIRNKYDETESILQQILNHHQQTKFFGSRFRPQVFIDELNNSNIDNQIELLTNLFCALNFNVQKANENQFYEMILDNAKDTFHVKLMIYRKIMDSDLLIFSTGLEKNKGIIVTLQPFDTSLLAKYDNKITVFTPNELQILLQTIDYLPTSKNSISKIMYGEHREKFVLINQLDFQTGIANLSNLLSNERITSPIGSLLEIFHFTSSDELSQFSEFISLLSKICSTKTLFELGNVVDIDIHNQIPITNNRLVIKAMIGKNFVQMDIPKYITNGNSSDFIPSDLSINKLLKCDCLAWLEQSRKINVCEHIVNAFFYLWKHDDLLILSMFKNNKTSPITGKYLLSMYIEEIQFQQLYQILESFWAENIENSNTFSYLQILKHEALIFLVKNYAEYTHTITNSDQGTNFQLSSTELAQLLQSTIENANTVNLIPFSIELSDENRLQNNLIVVLEDIIKQRDLMNIIVGLSSYQRLRVIKNLSLSWDQHIDYLRKIKKKQSSYR
jgi:hypothetical protein